MELKASANWTCGRKRPFRSTRLMMGESMAVSSVYASVKAWRCVSFLNTLVRIEIWGSSEGAGPGKCGLGIAVRSGGVRLGAIKTRYKAREVLETCRGGMVRREKRRDGAIGFGQQPAESCG